MSDKVEVKKLVLSVRGKELSLSPDEARELWRVLNEMYSQGTTWVPYPLPIPCPPYYWHIRYNDGTVYCDSGSNANTAVVQSPCQITPGTLTGGEA